MLVQGMGVKKYVVTNRLYYIKPEIRTENKLSKARRLHTSPNCNLKALVEACSNWQTYVLFSSNSNLTPLEEKSCSTRAQW